MPKRVEYCALHVMSGDNWRGLQLQYNNNSHALLVPWLRPNSEHAAIFVITVQKRQGQRAWDQAVWRWTSSDERLLPLIDLRKVCIEAEPPPTSPLSRETQGLCLGFFCLLMGGVKKKKCKDTWLTRKEAASRKKDVPRPERWLPHILTRFGLSFREDHHCPTKPLGFAMVYKVYWLKASVKFFYPIKAFLNPTLSKALRTDLAWRVHWTTTVPTSTPPLPKGFLWTAKHHRKSPWARTSTDQWGMLLAMLPMLCLLHTICARPRFFLRTSALGSKKISLK